MKNWILVLVCVVFFIPHTIFAQAPSTPSFSSSDSHPQYWATGPYQYINRKFQRLSSSANPGYDFLWEKNGPLANGERFVTYSKLFPNLSEELYEWERWTLDATNHQAILHQYGGRTETTSGPSSISLANCQSGITGHPWPSLSSNQSFAFTPESRKSNNQCPPEWQNIQNPGGYIAISLKDYWPGPFSSIRNQACDQYLPPSIDPVGNLVCKSSPTAGIIYQRYVIGSNSVHGCEATVYAWGYPQSNSENYRLWMRNGELRFSDFINLGAYSPPHPPDDHVWWDSQCQRAWQEKPNWLYTGDYQLDNQNLSSAITGDINLDDHVDISDYNLLKQSFSNPYTVFDLNQLVANFGK